MLVTVQRGAAGDLLPAVGPAGRTLRHDRLGADLHDGRGHVRHVSDDVCRGINNHCPAAVCVVVALYAAVRIWFDGERGWRLLRAGRLFGGAGGDQRAAGAVAVRRARGRRCCGRRRGQTLLAFCPPRWWWLAAFFGTNWIAHDSLRPPYVHRSETDPTDNWYDYTYVRDGRVRDSYWRNPQGVDRGEPSMAVYTLHATGRPPRHLFAHADLAAEHLGAGAWLWRRRPDGARAGGDDRHPVDGLPGVLPVPAAGRPQLRRHDQRLPLDVLVRAAVAGGDAAGGRSPGDLARGRGVALVLLALSVMSASYPTWNPWTHPWLWNFLSYLGWVG